MDCSPPGSSVHGTLQARILEWVAIPFSKGSSRHRDWTWVCPILQADSLPSELPGKPNKLPKGYYKDKSSCNRWPLSGHGCVALCWGWEHPEYLKELVVQHVAWVAGVWPFYRQNLTTELWAEIQIINGVKARSVVRGGKHCRTRRCHGTS